MKCWLSSSNASRLAAAGADLVVGLADGTWKVARGAAAQAEWARDALALLPAP